MTLTTGGFAPGEAPKEGGAILVRWSCGCTNSVKWVTGLTITHNLSSHLTEFILTT